MFPGIVVALEWGDENDDADFRVFFFFIHSFNSMNEFHFVVVQLLLTVAVELFVNS